MNPVAAPIAITPGDPQGIGPEVGVLAAAGCSDVVLVGDRELWTRAAALRGVDAEGLTIVPSDSSADPEVASIPELAAVATAVKGCLSGRFSAVSTGPIHKESVQSRGFPIRGTPPTSRCCATEHRRMP